MNQVMVLREQLKGLRITAVALSVTMVLFSSLVILACWAMQYGTIPCSNERLSILIIAAVTWASVYFIITVGLLAFISGLKQRIKRKS